jgi:positive regulator of sigma E activity
MTSETGIVTRAADGLATVHVFRGDSCGSCGSSCVCSTEQPPPRELDIVARNPINAKSGDEVQLAMEPETIFWLSLLTYIAPLLFLFAGALAGPKLARALAITLDPDLAAACFGFALLALSLVVLRMVLKRFKPGGELSPVIVKVINSANQE